MYDVNLDNSKTMKKICLLFFSIGIISLFVIIGILYFSNEHRKSLDAQTTTTRVEVVEGRDEDGDRMYSAVYYYDVDGKEYSCESSLKTSWKPDTNNQTVYYKSSDPSDCLSERDKGSSWFMYLLFLIPLGFIGFTTLFYLLSKKNLKKVKRLNEIGKLVKGLPYHLEDTGIVINNRRIPKIVIDYKLPDGNVVTLDSNPIYDKITEEKETADLLIDPNDSTNYYIDFEINRLTGNTSSDYYQKEYDQQEEVKFGVDNSQFN